MLFLKERERHCDKLLHLPDVQIICLETGFGINGFSIPCRDKCHKVKVLGNKHGCMVFRHLLLPLSLACWSIKMSSLTVSDGRERVLLAVWGNN